MIHLELQPEIEAQLAAAAQARGLPTEQHAKHIILSRLSKEDQALQEGRLPAAPSVTDCKSRFSA